MGQPLATYPADGEETVFHRQEFDSPLGDEDGWEGWSEPVPSAPLASWSEGLLIACVVCVSWAKQKRNFKLYSQVSRVWIAHQ